MAQHYDLHGVTLAVESDSSRVAERIASRLRTFAVSHEPPVPQPRVGIRLHGSGAPVPWPPEGSTDGRAVLSRPEVSAWWDPDTDVLTVDLAGRAGSTYTAANGLTEIWFDEDDPASRRAATHPLLTLALSESLKRHGLFDVHAGGAVHGGQAVLIPAASGSGKTTLTLALVQAGWDLLSDDMVLLRHETGGMRALPFADEVDVSQTTVEMLPSLAPAVAGRALTEPKWAIRLEEVWHVDPAQPSPPGLLLLPSVSGVAETKARPVSQSVALDHLLRNVLLTAPAPTRQHVALLAQLAALPAFALAVGTDLQRAAQVVTELLATVNVNVPSS